MIVQDILKVVQLIIKNVDVWRDLAKEDKGSYHFFFFWLFYCVYLMYFIVLIFII